MCALAASAKSLTGTVNFLRVLANERPRQRRRGTDIYEVNIK